MVGVGCVGYVVDVEFDVGGCGSGGGCRCGDGCWCCVVVGLFYCFGKLGGGYVG